MTVKDITAIAKIEAAYGYHYLNPILLFHYLYCDLWAYSIRFKFLEKRAQICLRSSLGVFYVIS